MCEPGNEALALQDLYTSCSSYSILRNERTSCCAAPGSPGLVNVVCSAPQRFLRRRFSCSTSSPDPSRNGCRNESRKLRYVISCGSFSGRSVASRPTGIQLGPSAMRPHAHSVSSMFTMSSCPAPLAASDMRIVLLMSKCRIKCALLAASSEKPVPRRKRCTRRSASPPNAENDRDVCMRYRRHAFWMSVAAWCVAAVAAHGDDGGA